MEDNKKKGCKPEKCYCGPFYFPQSIKCYISDWFNKACKKHDNDYRLNKGKIASDLRFYKAMIKISGYNPIKHLVAFFFFVMVFLGGWISYYCGEKGQEKD